MHYVRIFVRLELSTDIGLDTNSLSEAKSSDVKQFVRSKLMSLQTIKNTSFDLQLSGHNWSGVFEAQNCAIV